jgi:hypothetical protein
MVNASGSPSQTTSADASGAIDRHAIGAHPTGLAPAPDSPSAGPDGSDGDALERIRAQVEARAAGVLAHLAEDPDAWGADPDQHAAIRNAARAISVPASPAVATARERLGQLLHHPAEPRPPEPGPTLDAA